MLPLYLPGDFVLVWRGLWQRFGVADVVVVDHPQFGKIIKRVSHVSACGSVWLKGDNSAVSTSEAALGECEPKTIVGKVVWRIAVAGTK